MIKKIVIGVVVFAVLVLCGWKLFFSEGKVDDKLKNLETDMKAYHMEGTMQIGEGEDVRNFYVVVDYENDTTDNFRISLTDKDINQEQILLRNSEGVYVLTPVLNQVYTFEGDYPLNSPKPYLYHSFVDALNGDYEVTSNVDGFTVTYDIKYDNEPTWVKQEVKLSKDLKPVWTYVYDNENKIVAKVIFTNVDFAPVFDDKYFTVDSNMSIAKENISDSHVSTTIEDLPLIPVVDSSSSTLQEQTKITDNSGKVSYILTYSGVKSYTVFQTLVESHKSEEYKSIKVSGTPIDTLYGIGFMNGKCLNYLYHDVSYEIYSNDLSVAEMISVVTNMERVGVK